MPKDYIPYKDTEYQAWLVNFAAVMGLNLTTLGLSAGDLTSITALKSSFDLMMNEYTAKQVAAEAATQAKDTARKAAVDKSRELAMRIQAKVDVSNALKAQLGLTVPGMHPTPSEPIAPTDLTIEVIGSNLYKLKWNRGDNPHGTMFQVESSVSPTGNWLNRGTTTKASFETDYYNPEGPTYFRVKAQRGDLISVASNMVVI